MSCRIDYLPEFERELRCLAERYHSMKGDYASFLNGLKANSLMGVDMGGEIRNVQMAITSKGRGKSAGARAITYNIITHTMQEGRVVLVTIYDKSEQTNVTKREIVSRLKKAGIID